MSYSFKNYLSVKNISKLVEQTDFITNGNGIELLNNIILNPEQDPIVIYNELLGFHRPGGGNNPNWWSGTFGNEASRRVYQHNKQAEQKYKDMQKIVAKLSRVTDGVSTGTPEQRNLYQKAQGYIQQHQQGGNYLSNDSEQASHLASQYGMQGVDPSKTQAQAQQTPQQQTPQQQTPQQQTPQQQTPQPQKTPSNRLQQLLNTMNQQQTTIQQLVAQVDKIEKALAAAKQPAQPQAQPQTQPQAPATPTQMPQRGQRQPTRKTT